MTPTPCEDLFREQARSDPAALLAYVRDPSADPGLLTYAAEIAGSVEDKAAAVDALAPLLAHSKSYVREGAIYGLAAADTPEAWRLINHATVFDLCPAVRAVAVDAQEVTP